MRRPFHQLPLGTRFCQPDLDLTGTLLMVNECRARVRMDQPQQLVEFTSPDGSTRTFRAMRVHETSWAPTVLVEVLSVEPLSERDTTMAAKKATKKAPTKQSSKAATKAAAKTPPRAAKSDGKLSQLDAAVKVLAEAGTPMTTKAMIDAMAVKGYWISPGGATPWATLYSALIREIANKGADARFQKTDRGQFAINTGATTKAKPTAKSKAATKAPGKKAAKKKTGNAEIADGTPGPKAVSELFKI